MLIRFDVAGEPVEFSRSWLSGHAELRVHGEVVTLQDPSDVGTHVSVTLTRVWKHRLGEHEIVIEKVRPLLLSAFRPQSYKVLVDGKVVAEKHGF